MKTNKDFEIIDMNGRKRRIEKSVFGNLIGGFTSILTSVAIASVAISLIEKSLYSSKVIDTHLESGTRMRCREAARGKK